MAGRANRRDDSGGDGLVVICNIIANRSVPIVFILVGSLIIANISCDQVGSANDIDLAPGATNDGFESLASLASTAMAHSSAGGGGGNNGHSAGPVAKYDPLSMLREIYLDHDSKVITLLSSPNSNSVQKFHPNGRYGRRSVDNFADAPGAHTELAKLRFSGNDESNSLQDLPPATKWNSDLDSTIASSAAAKQPTGRLSWLLDNNKKLQLGQQPGHKQTSSKQKAEMMDASSSINSSSASYRQELNKLLKCNYSGVSNLFWCNS